MHFPLNYSALFALIPVICNSLAFPVIDSKGHISVPPPDLIALNSAHISRSLISSQGSGPLRYGQWKLLYSSLSLAITASPNGNPVVHSFGPLWNTVSSITKAFQNTSPFLAAPPNHMPFRCGDIELILTSTESMQWEDLASYADALVSLAGGVAGFWEVSFISL